MTSKEKRSLISIGNSLAVCLPHSWLNYHNIKAGDRVEVITKDKTAVIKLLSDGTGD